MIYHGGPIVPEVAVSHAISLLVNGQERRVEADPDRTLLEVLRDELDLTGAKYGCGEGQCGACTVLLDGRAVRSCLQRVGTVGGRAVRTIEGVAQGDGLHPLQAAFLEEGAMQCGYCTPGMVMSALSLLEATPAPTDAEITGGLQGNLCRCGCYRRIVAAVGSAARTLQRGGGR